MIKSKHFLSAITASLLSISTFAQAPFGTPPGSGQSQTDDGLFFFDGGAVQNNTGQSAATGNSIPELIPSNCTNTAWGSFSNPVIGTYGDYSNTTSAPCDDIYVNGSKASWASYYGRSPEFFANIENTGNDIRTFDSGSNFTTLECSVWDGDIPMFSIIERNTTGVDATFLIPLRTNVFGLIKDPDIIISPVVNTYSNDDYLPIVIVYELIEHGKTTSHIVYEHWNYNIATNQVQSTYLANIVIASPNNLHYLDPASILSDIEEEAYHPNIDCNINGDFVITFEEGNHLSGLTANSTSALANGNILSISSNLSGILEIDYSEYAFEPDVSIGSYEQDQIVHFVYNHFRDGVPHLELFTTDLGLVQSGAQSSIPVNPQTVVLTESYDHPRVATPRTNGYSGEGAVAISSIGPNDEVHLHYRMSSATSDPLGFVKAIDQESILYECKNERPAVTFIHDGSVTIGWTYNDCYNYSPNENKKGIALNYNFYQDNPINQRIPNDPTYFMEISKEEFKTQNYVSLSSENRNSGGGIDNHETYYTLSYNDPINFSSHTNGILHKLSKSASQPLIRKKAITLSSDYFIGSYPNPVSDELTILVEGIDEDSQAVITIKDITGKLIYGETGTVQSINKVIDVSTMTPGIYFINYQYNSETKTEKLIVQ